MTGVQVWFCGESYELEPDRGFSIGREGDLAVDDNPFLHRRFLRLEADGGLWWLSNVGSRIAATIADTAGGVQAVVRPGARMPLVFAVSRVVFDAGATTYEFEVRMDAAPYRARQEDEPDRDGDETIGGPVLTDSQRRLIVALAEPLLRHDGSGTSAIPDAASVAGRLGWTITRYNRKLDNVCDKFDRIGVSGVKGGPGRLAVNRRQRLVEYALATRVVVPADLALLDTAETDEGD